MKVISLLVFCVCYLQQIVAEDCPQYVSCYSSITQQNCPPGTFYRENVTVHGCCPGCVGNLKDVKESCVTSSECQPGLYCEDKKKTCQLDPKQPCEQYKRVNASRQHYTAQCLPDGTFAPVQCKGEKLFGKCFCVDKMGTRIFGESSWEKAENMTCACSRQMSEMKERDDVSIHCNDMGNFEDMQCDDGLCWCADAKTGQPYSNIVPMTMEKILPCFNIDTYGSKYLRRCDSIKVNQAKAKKMMELHGTKNIAFDLVNCNFDGSFGKVQIKDNKKTCSDRERIPLQEGVSMNDLTVNCNCAYDKFIEGDGFRYICETNGNYVKGQYINGNLYCVDSDGMPTTDVGVSSCP